LAISPAGGTVAHSRQIEKFQDLKDDGSTACGAWLYRGVSPKQDENLARSRRPDGAGPPWDASRLGLGLAGLSPRPPACSSPMVLRSRPRRKPQRRAAAKHAEAGRIPLSAESKITTSVKGETGNGGNITIDPQFVVLNQSSIIAQAIEGHGGNITISANQFLQSADSIGSASSALGISGTIEIVGPRVDLNGALVELSSGLRSAAQCCATAVLRKRSAAIQPGRGWPRWPAAGS
jgi:large exoprotein involved in heme utilization and adhesion